jgi:hypothetical protein
LNGRRCIIAFFCLALALVACRPSPATPPPATQLSPAPSRPPASSIPSTSKAEGSALISVDDVWNRYVNHALGISFLVPKSAYRWDAECEWTGPIEDGSYRTIAAFVPVVVLETSDRVIVTSQRYSEVTLPTQIPSGAGYRYNYGGCELREMTHQLVGEPPNATYSWDMRVSSISSVEDLELLIDQVFGECFSLGDMTPMEGSDMLVVKVRGDGKPVEESECLLREMYAFFYSPRHGKAAAWRTGQSFHFPSSTHEGYDPAMYESFTFLP